MFDNKKYQKEWKKQNKERILKKQREWHKKNPHKQKEYEANRNKEHRLEWKRKYFKENRERILKKHRIYIKNKKEQLRNSIIASLGEKCIKCGISDKRVLVIHHKDGGGNAQRRKYCKTGKTNDYRYLKELLIMLEDLDLLCSNCHTLVTHYNSLLAY